MFQSSGVKRPIDEFDLDFVVISVRNKFRVHKRYFIIGSSSVMFIWKMNGHFYTSSELKKLSEESLTRQPEEVFDIICKLGEGSVSNVYCWQ